MNTSRRNFVMTGLGLVSAAALMPQKLWGEDKKPSPPRDVDVNEPAAVALGYHLDADKVDLKKYPRRAGPEGKQQFCHSCNFYAKEKGGKGECQIFQNRLVTSNGWCNAWAAKAKKA